MKEKIKFQNSSWNFRLDIVLEIILNEVGLGNGFATKEFTIATSVIYKSFVNEDNVETTIASAATSPGP